VTRFLLGAAVIVGLAGVALAVLVAIGGERRP
jgi:hypothetical protein